MLLVAHPEPPSNSLRRSSTLAFSHLSRPLLSAPEFQLSLLIKFKAVVGCSESIPSTPFPCRCDSRRVSPISFFSVIDQRYFHKLFYCC